VPGPGVPDTPPAPTTIALFPPLISIPVPPGKDVRYPPPPPPPSLGVVPPPPATTK
jgi:hypothetical protein